MGSFIGRKVREWGERKERKETEREREEEIGNVLSVASEEHREREPIIPCII